MADRLAPEFPEVRHAPGEIDQANSGNGVPIGRAGRPIRTDKRFVTAAL